MDAEKWKKDMAELRRQWKAWLVLMEPFFAEHGRRARAFGIGVAVGEKGREDALQAGAPGNTDTEGEKRAFEMGVACGPILRAQLLRLAIEAIKGAKMDAWLRAILAAIVEALIGGGKR